MTNYDYLCLNFWTSLNYGAVLTAYATQTILESFGYTCAHIDYRYKHVHKRFKGSFTEKFASKYLNTTKECRRYCSFLKLNKICNRGYLVGSDQVFRDDYIKKTADYYLLNFATPNKQRIAISASFGKDSFNLKNKENSFKAFDSISVRESNAVDICKTIGIDSTHILDPVFLTDKSNFEKLTENIDIPQNLIVGYILDENDDTRRITNPYGENFINIAKMNVSVEEFLAYIKRSDKFITDSFHGTCFAIIFNKPFYTLGNANRGNSRFESLFNTFKITHDNLKREDWDEINSIIKQEQERGRMWFENTLETPNRNIKLKHKTFIKSFWHNLFRFKN